MKNVAFSSNGKKIISRSNDKAFRVWDSETGEELQRKINTNDTFCNINLNGKQYFSIEKNSFS